MSTTFARRSAVALTALFVMGCTSDTPAGESIAGADLQPPRLTTTQLADPNGVIVTVNSMGADGSVPLDMLQEVARQHAVVTYVDPFSKLTVVKGLTNEAALRKIGSIDQVMPNLEFRLDTDQSAAHFFSVDPRQQNLPLVRASNAWATPHNGANVNVCIIDSGIDDTHPDLAGRVSKAINLVNTTAANADGNGHGTHVASTVVSNGIGMASVAPDASLMNARTFDNAGGGATANVVLSAIRWCGREGAHVINMSLGFGAGVPLTSANQPLIAAFQAAINEVRLGTDPANSGSGGTVVVASAGNSNLRFPSTRAVVVPGGLTGVITVGSTSRSSNVRSVFSNRGTFVDMYAPGSNILAVCSTFTTNCLGGTIRRLPGTTTNTGRYMEISGTSMAAPHVAGVAAIAFSRLGTTRTPSLGERVENCLLNISRITGQVPQLPDPASARVDALLAATSPSC
ncbi:S8 family peptidase [Gemmatimonas sp.]|jgi:subtilisin family serine protease|uniref:S8 family peptidase n=1 Tax=Gemmatimonas sp. TaxID=1962908 RepID=UPI0037C13D55